MSEEKNIIFRDFSKITTEGAPWSIDSSKKSILITGATGLVGSTLVNYLDYLNKNNNNNFDITVMVRNEEKAKKLFENKNIKYLVQDIRKPLNDQIKFDFIVDCASNADPKLYASNPVDTIQTNVVGITNLLNYCLNNINTKVLFVSSVEVYGNTTGIDHLLKENDFGFTDCNTLRACYTESKRLSETLCQAYHEQYGVNCTIARLCKIYGPYITDTDSKVMAQMLRKVVSNDDIVLKSDGMQNLSFCYSVDVASALLYILYNGESCKAYNVADKHSIYRLKEIAEKLAKIGEVNVKYELPTADEKKGYSVIKDAIQDSSLLETLGWSSKINMEEGLEHSVQYLKSKNKKQI